MSGKEHTLKNDLFDLMKTDDTLFDFLQQGVLDGIWCRDLEKEDDQDWASPRFWEMLGRTPEDDVRWQDLMFEEDLASVREAFAKHCADPDVPFDEVVRYHHKDGSTVWMRNRGIAIRDDSGKPVRMVGVYTDLTPQKRAEEQVQRLSQTDALTGAYNRRYFLDKGRDEFSRARRYKTPLSLCIIDIDYFREVNDLYGHDAGDMVLKSLAAICLEAYRETDTFARLGGEEFGVLLPSTALEQAMLVSERMRNQLENNLFEYKDDVLKVTVSIGVALASEADESVEELISRANQALALAKEGGRNQVIAS